jgi:signal transduction histidine kinase/D-alanyl-D-alanine dipeptidase
MFPDINFILTAVRESILDPKTYKPLLLGICIVLIHILVPFDIFFDRMENAKHQNFDLIIKNMEQRVQDDEFNQHLSSNSFETTSTDSFEKWSKSPICYQVYSDNIEFWTKKSIILPLTFLNNKKSQTCLFPKDNKQYLVTSRKCNGKHYVGIIDLENYIKDHFKEPHFFKSFDSEKLGFQILSFPSVNSRSYKSRSGEFIFAIKKLDSHNPWRIRWNIILILTEFFLIFRSIVSFCRNICSTYPLPGVILFFGLINSIRSLMLKAHLPEQLYSLRLFNPNLYSGSNPSLGDLFLFILCSQFIIVFMRKNLVIDYASIRRYKLQFLIHTLTITLLLGEAFSMSKIFYGLVVESSVWFNFNYFPRFNVYSFVGLSIMLLTFRNYFALSTFLIKMIARFQMKSTTVIISLSINILLILVAPLFLNLSRSEVYVLFVILLLFSSISYIRYYKGIISNRFNVALFLFFASSVTTYLLHINNVRKDNLVLSSIASNLGFGRDAKLEKQLTKWLEVKAKNPSLTLDSSLKKTICIKEIDEFQFQKLTIEDSALPANQLRFKSEEGERFYVYRTLIDSQWRFFSIFPNNYLNQKKVASRRTIADVIIQDDNIGYAIYQNDSLIESSKSFGFSSRFKGNVMQNQGNQINQTFVINKELKAIISTKQLEPVSILTQFSYLFSFNLILYFVSTLTYTVFKMGRFDYRKKSLTTISNKIIMFFFTFVMTIFALIALLTYNNLTNKFEEYNQERLHNKIENIKLTLQNLSINLSSNTQIQNYIKKVEQINHFDIKLYDEKSFLLLSADTDIPNQEYLDPLLYNKILQSGSRVRSVLRRTSEKHSQEIVEPLVIANSSLSYLSLSSISNQDSQADSTKLIIALINLYVILFFVSMLIALWIANNITQPLRWIAERISSIDVTQKNEYLEYPNNDEIGELVKKYNFMLDQIAAKTRELVFAEREEAWSQMAKQIAHEIKNPLTPMKLKIQYLQKKIKEGSPDIEKLTESVTDTLLEQIQNLDSIASSFSEFSKLHHPNIEKIDWITSIKSVSNVFKNNRVEIRFATDLSSAFISCDPNQMTSCLNNIVKNAIQASDDNSKIIIDIHLIQSRNQYILQIQDYGSGIPEETQAKVFTPNFTSKSSESGLGLAITKKIIQSCGGQINFYSKVGHGTTFYIAIPIPDSYFEEKKYSDLEHTWIQKGLRDLSRLDLVIDLKYASSNNVFGQKLYLDFENAFVTKNTFAKLKAASELLKNEFSDYRLIVWDALRPHSIQQKMWDTYLGDQKQKYIADPSRSSMHNYGVAIDVGLVQITPEKIPGFQLLDFGCDFDEFSEIAHIDYMMLEEAQIDNRILLDRIMKKAGFKSYSNEWWHFESEDKDLVREKNERF